MLFRSQSNIVVFHFKLEFIRPDINRAAVPKLKMPSVVYCGQERYPAYQTQGKDEAQSLTRLIAVLHI